MPVHFGFPLRLDERGRTAGASHTDHVRELIEQVLFTSPGERVNRPDFGSGLADLLFAPGSDELAAAVQFRVQGALQRWLGDRIELLGVEVTAPDAPDGRLVVTVRYKLRGGDDVEVARFEGAAG